MLATLSVPTVARNCAGLGAVVCLLALGGCSNFDYTDPVESINRAAGAKPKTTRPAIYGLVAGDEPAAVSVGNNILLRGGSAADAAAAMALTLGVTYPSRASIGGGGVCLVGGGDAGPVKVLDFIPRAGTAKGDHIDRPTAVPTLLRGMVALHTRFGRISWPAVVAPALSFARDGYNVTKAFNDDLKMLATPLFADPASRTVFAEPGGGPLNTGKRLRQFDLSATLAQVSGRGAGEFYSGLLSRRFVDAVEAAGGSLTSEDLRGFLPEWREPVSVRIGKNVLHVPTPPASAGVTALQIVQMMLVDEAYLRASPDERPHLVLEAAKRAYIDRSVWSGPDGATRQDIAKVLSPEHAAALMKSYTADHATPAASIGAATETPELDAGASFIVVDGQGLAVTCELTMYHVFGTGRTASGLGIVLAAAPGKGGRNPLSLGPVVVTRAEDGAFRFAFSSSGGKTGATALSEVMLRALLEKQDLESAMDAPRVHHSGVPDIAVIEDRGSKEQVVQIIQRGHQVERLKTIGRVNAAACPEGLPAEAPRCEVGNDPRGEGLAIVANPTLPGS